MRNHLSAAHKILGIGICFIVFLSGCSNRNSSALHQYYTENYPASSPIIKQKVEKVEKSKEDPTSMSKQATTKDKFTPELVKKDIKKMLKIIF